MSLLMRHQDPHYNISPHPDRNGSWEAELWPCHGQAPLDSSQWRQRRPMWKWYHGGEGVNRTRAGMYFGGELNGLLLKPFSFLEIGWSYVAFGFPRRLGGKESACQCRWQRRLELGRSSGGGNGNPLQYSCLEDPGNRGAWWATVQGVAKSRWWLRTHSSWPLLWPLR